MSQEQHSPESSGLRVQSRPLQVGVPARALLHKMRLTDPAFAHWLALRVRAREEPEPNAQTEEIASPDPRTPPNGAPTRGRNPSRSRGRPPPGTRLVAKRGEEALGALRVDERRGKEPTELQFPD